MRAILLFVFGLSFNLVFAQYGDQDLTTDSSDIEIRRNSVYKIWEETYTDKDSVFYSVWYIDDTTQLHTKGWHRKNGNRFGKWVEYTSNDTWLYEIDYDNNSWKYNEKEYPFQTLLDSIKGIADKMVIAKYGRNFFDTDVRFMYHGGTYIYDSITYNSGTFWTQEKYLGTWTDPIKERPNTYSLNYSVGLKDDQFYCDELEIWLDSSAIRFKQSSEWHVDFEDRIKGRSDTFSLTYDNAIRICSDNGLIISDTIEYETDLQFVFWKSDRHAGKFIYRVKQYLNTRILEGDCPRKCKTETIYREWIIDPWTTTLLENKKYKRLDHWSRGCGGGESFEIADYMD